MPLLTLDSVSLAYGHLPLFEEADLRVDAGERICLIGRNGSGKSSLLKVVSGEIAPDAGKVWRAPGLKIARLEQDVPGAADRSVFDEVADGQGELGAIVAEYHHAAMTAAESGRGLERLGALQHELEKRDGWRLEQNVELVISRLSLPADRPMKELSGGWRRRALLGKALVSEPDLLLLDEPTNHLDIEAIQWLEAYLRGYAGAILFVTHDRSFLASLSTRIVELDRGTLTSWPGSYASYLEKKTAAIDAEAREIERLDRKLAREEAWLRQGIKARRTRNEGRVRALVALRAERAAFREHSGTVRMSVDSSEGSGRLVVDAEAVTKAFDGVTIIRDFSQRIFRGDRVGLIGPNGSGKTTLLRLLVGEIAPDAGTIRHGTKLRIAYFDQQREQLDPDATVADSVNEGNPTIVLNGEPRHVIGYLGDFLFPRERALSPVCSLSGGERNRLMLARLFARPANVLVLDEPTNDLDLETLELLEELVAGFDGTVLLVSHDRTFLDHIVTSTLAFEGEGRVVEYVGGWEDYLRQAAARERPRPERGAKSPRESEREPSAGASANARAKSAGGGAPAHEPRWGPASTERSRQNVPNVPVAPGEPGKADPALRTASNEPRVGSRRKLTYNEQRELDALPSHIEALEAEQQRLRHESESQEFYKERPEHIRAVLARLEQVGRELESALGRWMILEELGASVPKQ